MEGIQLHRLACRLHGTAARFLASLARVVAKAPAVHEEERLRRPERGNLGSLAELLLERRGELAVSFRRAIGRVVVEEEQAIVAVDSLRRLAPGGRQLGPSDDAEW